jgi:hypothetical protein
MDRPVHVKEETPRHLDMGFHKGESANATFNGNYFASKAPKACDGDKSGSGVTQAHIDNDGSITFGCHGTADKGGEAKPTPPAGEMTGGRAAETPKPTGTVGDQQTPTPEAQPTPRAGEAQPTPRAGEAQISSGVIDPPKSPGTIVEHPAPSGVGGSPAAVANPGLDSGSVQKGSNI